jgi:hypothetical protein
MIHRPPEGVPRHLLDGAERQALQDFGGGGNDWQKACRDAAREAIEHPDARFIRTIGLSSSALRPGRNLGEHHLGDDLGRQILTTLANRQRGEE